MKKLREYLAAQNVAAAQLRGAMSADPFEIPLEIDHDPSGGLVGRVENIQFGISRWGALTATLWIARWRKKDGSRRPTSVVEMRGGWFASGYILPGDWVQLPKDHDLNTPLRSLINLQRGMLVEMKGKTINYNRLDRVIPLFRG